MGENTGAMTAIKFSPHHPLPFTCLRATAHDRDEIPFGSIRPSGHGGLWGGFLVLLIASSPLLAESGGVDATARGTLYYTDDVAIFPPPGGSH